MEGVFSSCLVFCLVVGLVFCLRLLSVFCLGAVLEPLVIMLDPLGPLRGRGVPRGDARADAQGPGAGGRG